MSKPQPQTKKIPIQNFAIFIAAFFVIGILLGPGAGQVYTGTSATGSDTVELTNNGNLDTKVRDFSLTSNGGVDGNLNYIEFSPDESMISGSNTDMSLGLYIYIPSGVSVDGGNVRVTDQNNNKMPREIESYVSGYLMVWYKPSVTDGSDSVYRIWYGDTTVSEPAPNSLYGSQAVWVNYVAVYHMNQEPNAGGANSILDSTVNVKHLTPHGWVANSLKDGLYGKYIDFDYSNSNYMTADGTDFEFATSDFSMLYHLNSDYGGGIYLASKLNTANANDGWFQYYSAGQTKLQMREYGTESSSAVDGGGVSANGWHTLSFSVDRDSASGMRNINDGGSPTISNPTSVTDISSTGDLFIGALYTLSGYISADISEIRYSGIARSDNFIITTHNNLYNPTSGGTNPFYKSIGVEQVVGITDSGIGVGDDILYYDGILLSTLTYSDGSAYIDSSDVTTDVKGSLPVIKVGTTQNIKIDHDLEYSITYIPKNMDVTSPDMLRANEDVRIDTRLTDTSGNPVSNQPLEMRARLFDSDDNRYLDEIISSIGFVIPGEYIKSGKHYQLRLSYSGFEFGGWSNEILVDFDVGTEGFTITSSPDKAPESLSAASFAAASNMVGMAVTGWLDIPIIGDIIKFIADLVGVTL